MPELRLREHGKCAPVQLTPAQRDALLALPAQITCTPLAGQADLYELQTSSWVGVTRIGDLMLSIEPKIPMDRVLFLLSQAAGDAWFGSEEVTVDAAERLHEVVGRIFARLLRGALRCGVPQGYESRDEALATVRGRIRFDDQLRVRHGLFLPVEVRFDEFTEDIELNRILKAAANLLRQLLPAGSTVRAELARLASALQRVRDQHYLPGRVPDPRLSRLTEHVRPALSIARWILSHQVPELGCGTVRSTALLFDMNRLFEDFLFSALGAALRLSGGEWVRGTRGKALYLDEEQQVALQPDLSWWVAGRCVFVGDAKYKAIAHNAAPPGDLYQMLAYLVATGLQRGLLVYGSIRGGSFCHRIQQGDRELWLEQIDLSGTPESIEVEVKRLAQVVKGLSGQRGRWGLRGLATTSAGAVP